ncbi:MAG: hypothetical protein LCH51_03320 [Bacteroidetes bacterium]|nr:hypothetical protein [Bacteroidota bacterium]
MFTLLGFLFSITFILESVRSRFLFYNYKSDSVLSVSFIILSCWYFYLLLQQEQPVALKRFAPFWVVSGIFLFCFGSMAAVLFSEEVMQLYIVDKLSVRLVIYSLLNLLLYGCWSYAFVCKYRETI